MSVGAACNIFVVVAYDRFLTRAKQRNATWARVEEYRRLPLACMAGPLYVMALLWLVGEIHPSHSSAMR